MLSQLFNKKDIMVIGISFESNFRFYEEIKDDLKFYGSSSVRMKILLSLLDGSKKTKQLRELTGIQSSTIIHGINELEKQNVVLRKGDNYYLSEIGHILTLKLVQITKTLDVLTKFRNLWLNHEIVDIPPELLMNIGNLSDSNLIEANNADIAKTHTKFTNIVLQSKNIRGVSTVFHPDFTNIFEEVLQNEEVEVELILSDAILKETIKSINPKNLRQFLKLNSNGNLHIWALKEEVKVAFTVTEKYLSLGFYTRDGVYDSYRDLISESTDAIKWANDLFEYYKKKSDKIELKRLDKLISHLI